MTKQEKTTKMVLLARQWQESGKSQDIFAQENNISAHTLRYWLYKRKDLSVNQGGFVQLKGISPLQEYVIRYPNGIELRFPADMPVSVVKSLINY